MKYEHKELIKEVLDRSSNVMNSYLGDMDPGTEAEEALIELVDDLSLALYKAKETIKAQTREIAGRGRAMETLETIAMNRIKELERLCAVHKIQI